MANVLIKSEERRRNEAYILNSFGKSGKATGADKEAAEIIAARTKEAYGEMKRMEEKNG